MTRTISENKIECPKCHHNFALADSVEKKVREQLADEFQEKELALKAELEEQSLSLKEEVAKRDRAIAAQKLKTEEAVRAEKESLEKEYSQRLIDTKKSLEASARAQVGGELALAKEELEAQSTKLREAQAKELELRRAQRELESAKQEFELESARKLDEERERIRLDVEGRIGEQHHLKSLEWQKKQSDMEKLIEELRKKSEQGSQQAQGEVLELEVEATLREVFPHDSVEPVAKGVVGADVLQVVKTRGGTVAGSILWEIKRTKNFSEAWVAKLKDNQRSARAEVAVILTTALPEGVQHMGQLDGVWVCDFQSFTGIALALRASLLEVAQVRASQHGAKEKAEEVYEYLNGLEFRNRVQGLVESLASMKEDLEAERRAFEKIWAKREKTLLRAMNSTAGFYGDFQGLVGSSLQEIPQLSLESK